jgi:hypothetical protein
MVDKTPAQIIPGNANDDSVVHASDASLADLSRSHAERDISRLQGTAPLFQVTKTYIINDLVTQINIVYRNIIAIPVPGAFNPTEWQAVSIPQTPWFSDIDADQFNLLDLGYLEMNDIAEPATPAANLIRLWAENDSGFDLFRYKGNNGVVNTLLQDDLVLARNITGSTILEGQVVRFTGANGNKITIDLAQANVSATMPAIGVALQDIPNNTNGTVMLRGRLTGINTNAFTAGDILYVSETTLGGVTNVKPIHPNLSQLVGVVTVSNPTTGEIDILIGSLNGDEDGTNSNTFKIGDGLAGTKSLELVNVNNLSLEANPSADRTQTFQDADGIIALQGDIFNYQLKRQILLAPSAGADATFVGLGAGVAILDGALISTLDGDGYYLTFAATAGMMTEPGGLLVADSVRRDLNFDVVFKFRLNVLANGLFAAGFFELDPLNNPIASNEHFGLWRDDGDANPNFKISHSDGVTLTQTQIGVADTNVHTIRLKSDEANSKFQYSWDGGALVDVTINIPAATTNLIMFEEYEDTLALGGVTVDIWFIDGVADT